MTDILVPILVFSVPVLAVVFLAMIGRGLKGTCGGVGPDGSCARCGKPADAMPAARERGVCP